TTTAGATAVTTSSTATPSITTAAGVGVGEAHQARCRIDGGNAKTQPGECRPTAEVHFLRVSYGCFLFALFHDTLLC
ncbi:MAG: hypothetical protein B0D87_07235, partial [Candidatus Sedimenticola endophacoides]